MRRSNAAGGRASLGTYREKRNFRETREPRGRVQRRAGRRAFVVQKHDARTLHYDFRLELDGVLKSWAVPKGPSDVVGDKRLAVQVEDHPLEYASFEGKIPAGHYGAGDVRIWDEGEWVPRDDPHEGLAAGKLTFRLEGRRLHGTYSLIRIRRNAEKPQWLLLKQQEPDGAAPAPPAERPAERESPRRRGSSPPPSVEEFRPELATLTKTLPTGADWYFEPKLDGYRALARIERGRVTLASRSGADWTERFPALVAALQRLDVKDALLDGEICALGDDGIPRFQLLQNIGGSATAFASGRSSRAPRVVYYLFDVPFLNGEDLRGTPLSERKARLADIRGRATPLVLVEHVLGAERGAQLYAEQCGHHGEGVVAKRAGSRYVSRRTLDWVKVKCHERQEVVVVGYTAPRGGRKGIGALLVAVHGDRGGLRYAGKVGTGFDAETLESLAERLAPLSRDEPLLDVKGLGTGVTWVEPVLVADVAFTEWTRDGLLRHPAFVGLREDKAPAEVRREVPASAPTTPPGGSSDARRGVKITHGDRVVDATTGTTKADLARYYDTVSSALLPYVAGRGLALLRCPGGTGAACFFQKHRTPGMPPAVHETLIASQGVLHIDDAVGLLSLVQFGAVELHAWGSLVSDPLRPDWLVVDLDPAEDVPFSRTVEGAEVARELLRERGLEAFVRTTGGKGLHVVAPIVRGPTYDEIRAEARAIAERLEQDDPTRYVATATKQSRPGRIFVDYLRNGLGSTSIVPFSVRARPGMPVAMPVSWEELRDVDPMAFTVDAVPALLAERRRDPWGAFFDSPGELRPPVARASPKRRSRGTSGRKRRRTSRRQWP
ncbi:MAG TPA: DNA ligase D [Polyangiaceae bacterium]|nr:DNA ligase D [Polyangiaceae bacterium]